MKKKNISWMAHQFDCLPNVLLLTKSSFDCLLKTVSCGLLCDFFSGLFKNVAVFVQPKCVRI